MLPLGSDISRVRGCKEASQTSGPDPPTACQYFLILFSRPMWASCNKGGRISPSSVHWFIDVICRYGPEMDHHHRLQPPTQQPWEEQGEKRLRALPLVNHFVWHKRQSQGTIHPHNGKWLQIIGWPTETQISPMLVFVMRFYWNPSIPICFFMLFVVAFCTVMVALSKV